jgi:hypothetical protein
MLRRSKTSPIREVVGAFFELDDFKGAVNELIAAGFARESISMLAGEYTVRQKLGDYYTQVNKFSASAEAPQTAFIAKEAMGDTVHALFGSLYFLGATVAAGAVVVSAGALASALFVAVTGAATISAISIVLSTIIHQSDADEIEQQIDEGHLVLFVRTADPKQEKLAVEILTKHAGSGAKVYSVKPEE